MTVRHEITKLVVTAVFACVALMGPGSAPAQTSGPAHTPSPAPAAAPGILNRDQAAAVFPATVFYRGQTASIQGRNSAGVRLLDNRLVLAALVDTSGYSSGVAETYQAYLLTEVPITFGGQVLKPGSYGFGFIAGDRMVIMDISGTEMLHASTSRDTKMTRPTPLQIVQDGANYRLYLGRNYVSFAVSAGAVRLR